MIPSATSKTSASVGGLSSSSEASTAGLASSSRRLVLLPRGRPFFFPPGAPSANGAAPPEGGGLAEAEAAPFATGAEGAGEVAPTVAAGGFVAPSFFSSFAIAENPFQK